jgi:hypothetical protein
MIHPVPFRRCRQLSSIGELAAIADKIIAAVNVNAVANVLTNIDKLTPQLQAFTEGRPAPTEPTAYRITARQEPGKDTVTVGLERITGDDLAKLDPRSIQLIRAYESTMNDLFDRFTELEPKRSARDSEVRQRARAESEEVRQEVCEEWTKILNYLASLGKRLDDHYKYVQFICERPAKGSMSPPHSRNTETCYNRGGGGSERTRFPIVQRGGASGIPWRQY